MPKMLLLLLFTAATNAGFGQQNPFMNDAVGRPLYLRTNYMAEGSPYLFESYRPAELTTVENKVYKDVNIKINLLENLILFVDDKGEEMIASLPIKRIKLAGIDKNGALHDIVLQSLHGSLNTPNDSVFQVLDSGKVSLLKNIRVNYTDEKKYGQAGVTRVFRTSHSFYLYVDGHTVKLEKNKSSVLEALSDQRARIEAFVSGKSLSYRSETDLTTIVHYYNSL